MRLGVTNQNGGAGKTTTTLNVAGVLDSVVAVCGDALQTQGRDAPSTVPREVT